MPNQHTPEPWDDASQYPEFQSIRIFAKTHFIATVGNSDDTKEQTSANAARIVSCVNALAGVADPAETLKAVREALELGESWMKCAIESTEWTDDAFTKQEHGKAKAELATVRAALALLPATTEASKS